ncbi:hypothetical protein V6N13_045703 [Hibiscus sabdariffa]
MYSLVPGGSKPELESSLDTFELIKGLKGILMELPFRLGNSQDLSFYCNCDDMETEVSSIELSLPEEVMEEGDMVSSGKDSCIAGNDIIAQESEEDDSLSLEGDRVCDIDSSCSLSVASETSSFCGEDFLGFDATSGIDIEKNICGLDIIAKATLFVESNVETDVASDPIAVVVSLEEEVGDQSEGALQLAHQKEETTMIVPVPRSVFEVEYVPLWDLLLYVEEDPRWKMQCLLCRGL